MSDPALCPARIPTTGIRTVPLTEPGKTMDSRENSCAAFSPLFLIASVEEEKKLKLKQKLAFLLYSYEAVLKFSTVIQTFMLYFLFSVDSSVASPAKKMASISPSEQRGRPRAAAGCPVPATAQTASAPTAPATGPSRQRSRSGG